MLQKSFCDRKNYIKKTPVVQILSYISTAGTEGHRSGGYSNITVSYVIMSVYFFGNDVKGYGCFCKSSRVPPCVPAACQGPDPEPGQDCRVQNGYLPLRNRQAPVRGDHPAQSRTGKKALSFFSAMAEAGDRGSRACSGL